MKIAVFSTHVMWHRHFETELEIMQRDLDAGEGNEVHEFVCDRRLLCCDILTTQRMHAATQSLATARDSMCKRCIKTRQKGVSLIDGTRIERPIVSNSSPALQFEYTTLDELKQIKVEGFLLGQSVASILISAFRNVRVNVQKFKPVLDDCLLSALQLYYSTKERLQHEKFDRAYIFNGRYAHTHAIVAACRAVGLDFYTYEMGCDQDHFSLFHNSMPHDFDPSVQRIDEHWAAESDLDKKRSLGALFYNERPRGLQQERFSYIKSQNSSLLPNEWDSSKRNLVIFTSTTHEFEATEDDLRRNTIFRNQLAVITTLVSDSRIKSVSDLNIYVRIHPNLALSSDAEVDALLRLNSEQVIAIPPESRVSSYKMLWECEKVLSFGSTMGIEATFWGKPSILAGVATFQSHDATYNPTTFSELIDLVLAELPAKSREAALKYGYYCQTFGIRYRFFKPRSLLHGTFKGRNLELYRDSYIRGTLKLLFPHLRRSAMVERCLLILGLWKKAIKERRQQKIEEVRMINE